MTPAATPENLARLLTMKGRPAERPARTRRCSCGSILAEDGTCPACGSTLYKLDRPRSKPTDPPPQRTDPCPRRCGKAVHKGRCGGMETPARREAAEERPVRLAAPRPEPETPEETCEETPQETPVMEAATAVRICPVESCGKPAGHTGCHRGLKTGPHGTKHRSPEVPAAIPQAPVAASPQPGNRPGPVAVLPEGLGLRPADPELAALAALLSLSPAAMGRVIRYASERMEEVAGG